MMKLVLQACLQFSFPLHSVLSSFLWWQFDSFWYLLDSLVASLDSFDSFFGQFWTCDLVCLVWNLFSLVCHLWLGLAFSVWQCNLFGLMQLCAFCKIIFLSLFVNQEETSSCDLQRGRTNWFRPTTFNDELLLICLKNAFFQINCIDFSFSGFAGKYQLGQGKQQ